MERFKSPARAIVLRMTLVVTVCLLTLIGADIAVAERTIGLSSGSFEFLLEPGAVGEGEVIAINDGDESFKVLVYTANQVVDESGEKSFVVPSRDVVGFLDSPASWVRIDMPAEAKAVGNTPYLEMDPGDRVPVGFTMAVPGNAAPGDHNVVLFFEIFEFNDEEQVNASEITGRLGTRLQIRVNGDLIERMEVRPFSIPSFVIGNRIPYEFTVTNGGNINKRIELNMALLDGDEKTVVESTVASDWPVYAGAAYEEAGEILLPSSIFGRHQVLLTMEYPSETAEGQVLAPAQLEKSRTVWVVPTWLVFALAGLVIYVIGVIVWQMAKKAARKRHARDRAERRRSRDSRGIVSAEGALGTRNESGDSPSYPSRGFRDDREDELTSIELEKPAQVDASRSWGDELDVDFGVHPQSDDR